MGYRAIKFFTDLTDSKYAYHVGDTFPREGLKVTKKRINELLSNNNKRGVPVIEEVDTEEAPSEVKEEPPIEEAAVNASKTKEVKRSTRGKAG